MITNETDGFLFNLSNDSQIIEPLKKLYNNFSLIASIAENAKKSASVKFNCEKVAERTISFYKKIN
jgi:glycosyltransferase involved in cell wall biosynthesis